MSLGVWLKLLCCRRRRGSLETREYPQLDSSLPETPTSTPDRSSCRERKGTFLEPKVYPRREPLPEVEWKGIGRDNKNDRVSVVVLPQLESTRSKPNRALVVVRRKTYALVDDFPYPQIQNEDEIIISNRAVGLNPIDWKSVDYNFCLPQLPWITGREMSGIVDAVGKNVTDVKVGDRVWTSTYYKDRRAGCFQQYVAVPQHTVAPIPANLDFVSAACLGVAGLTAAMTLWRWLDVPMSTSPASTSTSTSGKFPRSSTEYLLVWGGSAVTAQFAIQLAIRGGMSVIAVTSERTRSIALSLGARYAVARDGKTNEAIVSEIRALVAADDNDPDSITRAIDLVGPETASHCLRAMSTTRLGSFAPLAMISNDMFVPANITVHTVEMKQFVLNPECRFYALELNRLVSQGAIKLPSIEVFTGGLDRIQVGLERIKNGDLAGKKLVVSMAT